MGGGFVVDGELYRGFDHSHPEIAHQTIPYRRPIQGPIECACGALDCLEAVVCGTAIRKIYGKPATELVSHEWDQVAYNLGQGLRNAAMLYAPRAIVLGGGMALGGGERLLAGVRDVLAHSMKIVPQPTVTLSTLGYDTALWGGLALILNNKVAP
jgi:predicted NBD/HSP70 family sugar kinase